MLSTFNWSWLFLYEENVSWDTKISTNNWKNFWDLFICWFVPVFSKHFESHFHIWFKRAYECVAAINTTSSIPCAPPPSPLLNIFLFILNINYNINNNKWMSRSVFICNVHLHRCGVVDAASHCTSGHHGEPVTVCHGGTGWEDRNAALFLSA